MFPHNGFWDWLGGYTGALVLYLILCGVWHKGRHYPSLIFFAGFGLFIVLKNFGFPLAAWLGRLPLFDQSWSPRWAGCVWTFSLSCAAAVGLEQVLQASHRNPKAPWIAAALLLVAGGALAN